MMALTTNAGELGQLLGGFIGIALVVFVVTAAVLWFLLPFAIFGIKPLLRELIREVRNSRNRSDSSRARKMFGEGDLPDGLRRR